MKLEEAILYMTSGQQESFEKDIVKSGQYIGSIQGYCGHGLQK